MKAEVRVEKIIGARGDIEIECDALLEEHGVYNEEFTHETDEFMKKFREELNERGEYVIPDVERQLRWDLT